MTDVIDWSQYRPADLHQASAGTVSQSAGGISACNSNSFPVDQSSRRRANLVADYRDPFIPASSDHALGLAVVFGCAFGSAVSILYLSYRVAEFLFGVRL